VVQRAERITTASGASGVAYYSLGNLASNQPYPSTVLGGAARLTFKKVTSAETGTTTTVVDCQMIPTVCHCESGKTRVYLLKDYTDELAEKHWVNTFESGSITLDSLERQWDETFSH
jgi:hypothetical protein